MKHSDKTPHIDGSNWVSFPSQQGLNGVTPKIYITSYYYLVAAQVDHINSSNQRHTKTLHECASILDRVLFRLRLFDHFVHSLIF